MRGWLPLLLLWLLAGASGAAPLPRVPLPIQVSTGLYVVSVEHIDDSQGEFQSTFDLRLSWLDPSLADHPVARELGPEATRELLGRLWAPQVHLENLAEGHTLAQDVLDEGLTISPDGRVQWIRRIRCPLRCAFDFSSFPMDRQQLTFRLTSPEEPRSRLVLVTDQAGHRFSGRGPFSLAGWQFGPITYQYGTFSRWNSASHSLISVQLTAIRQIEPYLYAILLPMLAVMLVPLLALWLNRWKDKAFVIEPFELMNIATGGLFATIALTLAVYSFYPFLSSGQNLIGTLFILNYLLLAVSMLAILTLFKSQLDNHSWFCPYLALEFYRYLCWSLPALTLAAMVGIVLWAMP